MAGTPSGITNPHLEITANRTPSEVLQRVFDYRLFAALYAEDLRPDIMGFVCKKKSSNPEIMIIEVKKKSLKIKDVLQAKMYGAIFSAKFSFIISRSGISIPALKTILEHDSTLRGDVIIGQCSSEGQHVRFYPEMLEYVPKELRSLCINKTL